MTERLNYTTHCIEFLRPLVDHQSPDLGQWLRILLDTLAKVPKFQLPDTGRVVDDPSVERLLAQARLPFPCVALEYAVPQNTDLLSDVQVAAPKRIALAWDLHHGWPAELRSLAGESDLTPRHALLVAGLFATRERDMTGEAWAPVPGFLEVPLLQNMNHGIPAEVFDTGLRGMRPPEVDIRKVPVLTAHVPYVCPSFAPYHSAGSLATPVEHVLADLNDEVWTALSFAALCACANVHTELVAAPAKLNKKRLAHHKTPLFDVNVLTVAEGGFQGRAKSTSGGGSHASPRTHLRRGHIRQLPDRAIWVNAAVVNAASGAAVVPQYAVRRDANRQA